MFFRPRNDKVSAIATTLAAACAVAHVSFFTLFAWRVIGRAGMGSHRLGAARALRAPRARLQRRRLLPVKNGGRTPARKWGYWAIATSTGIAGVLLAIAAVTG